MKAIGNLYWALMLIFAGLYAMGFRLISIEMLLVPIVVNALISVMRAIPRMFGADLETLAYSLIFGISIPIVLLNFILASAGSQAGIEDLALSALLCLIGIAAGQKVDHLAYFEIIVLGSMFIAPFMLSDGFIPYFLFILIALLLWGRMNKPDGRKKDAGSVLFGIDFSRRVGLGAARPAIIVLSLSAMFLAGILFIPSAIVPLSIAFISCGRLIGKE